MLDAGIIMKRRALAMPVLALITWMVGCGYARLPHPPYIRQTPDAWVEIPYPPPPARVEFVPDKPRDAAVWVDGEWTWHGRRWGWRPGRWVIPASGTAFSPRALIRNAEGTLFIAEGRWRDVPSGREVLAPPVLALGKASPGDVVDPEGESTKTGQDVPVEGTDAGAPRPAASVAPPAGPEDAGARADAS